MKKKKYLIIRFSSIGDIVLTTPVVRCLKKQTDAEVHYLSKKQFAGILSPNPYIDKLHLISEDVAEVLDDLRAEQFDAVIDLHHNLRTLKVKRALGVPAYSFPKLNIQKFILVNFKINLLPDVHIVERYMQTVAHLGVQNDGAGLDYFLSAQDEMNLQTFLPPAFEAGYVAFVIGGQHEGKMCSAEKITRICKSLNKPVVLLGGPEDAAKGETISREAGPHVFNAAGKCKLGQSAYLLKMSDAVITHDTGLMHVASAFKKKVISLWGGTVPELGMYPYLPGVGSKILEVKHVMRPSSKLGSRKGIYRLWNFMDMIPEEAVIAALQEKTNALTP
jgi:ADP-heptose:LPS heptosyltransferase